MLNSVFLFIWAIDLTTEFAKAHESLQVAFQRRDTQYMCVCIDFQILLACK